MSQDLLETLLKVKWRISHQSQADLLTEGLNTQVMNGMNPLQSVVLVKMMSCVWAAAVAKKATDEVVVVMAGPMEEKNDPKNKGASLPPMSIVMTNGPVSTTTMTMLKFQPWSPVVTKAEVTEAIAAVIVIVTLVRTKKNCSNSSSSNDPVVKMNNVSEEETKESPSKLRLKDVRISFLLD